MFLPAVTDHYCQTQTQETQGTSQVYSGTLKRMHANYGFIHCEPIYIRCGRDVFVRKDNLPQSIKEGSQLFFSVEFNQKGQPRADNVSLVDMLYHRPPPQLTKPPEIDSAQEQDANNGNHHGVLKSFSNHNGYGFIMCPELRNAYGRDVFVHAAELPNEVDCGAELTFTVGLNSKGQPQAHNVKLVDTWESDELAGQSILPMCSNFEKMMPLINQNATVRIMSWNILAPAYATCSKFPDADPACLRWSRRAVQIKEIIANIAADVMCFQEVPIDDEHMDDLGLNPNTYKSFSCKRPDGRTDGCTIAWRSDSFALVSNLCVSFDEKLQGESRMHTGHVAAIVELQPRASGCTKNLVVATMHLAWGDSAEDVRVWQLSALFHELVRYKGAYIVICGDMNSVPCGKVYELLSKSFRSAYSEVESDMATASSATAEGGAGFAETIDYCWLPSDCGALHARLKLPTKHELRDILGGQSAPSPIPTLVASGGWPSDHLPVAVELQLP